MFRRPLSIRLIVALLMAAPVIAIAAMLAALSSITAHRIAESLGEQLVDRATTTVENDVRDYLSSAVRVSDQYAWRLHRGELPSTGLLAWEKPMFGDLTTNPDVASICFGNAAGDASWMMRHAGRIELGRAEGLRENFAQEFVVDPATGEPDLAHPIRTYQYDPRKRPWYSAALESDKPAWTPIYFWFGDGGGDLETGTGYTRTIRRNEHDDLRGVLVVDVTLGALSKFLRRLPLAQHGFIFIIDAEQMLVASSHGAVNSADGQRILLARHEHEAARAVAAAIDAPAKSRRSIARTDRIKIGGLPARIRVTDFSPQPGLDWNIITVIPESVFLSEAQTVKHRAIFMGIIAILGALVLGWLLSRSVSGPIMRLREHAHRIGGGEFEHRLHLKGAKEWQDLSEDLNQMGRDLKDRMNLRQSLAVATEVQQSLLPQSPPKVEGLDIAGHSKYCETTGGDYFDFIDVAELPTRQTVIAVGDVMGHGIASALLMATARAALRATALKEGSLGNLMNTVNQVLARDARHQKFMTMAMAVIDPAKGSMRWASAGHDPPIIYSPVRGEFREPSGGDLPLGLFVDIQYEEYAVTDIEPGSIIVIGTDGVWEAPGPGGENFGKQRLRDVVRALAHETAHGVVHGINKALVEFSKKDRFPDDVTFVVVKLWLG